jgi:hypothetical protein
MLRDLPTWQVVMSDCKRSMCDIAEKFVAAVKARFNRCLGLCDPH